VVEVHKEVHAGSYVVPSHAAGPVAVSSRVVSDALWALSLTEQVRRLRTRDLSAVELALSILDRISEHNPRLLAFCALDPDWFWRWRSWPTGGCSVATVWVPCAGCRSASRT
jgi:hypothetical protein